MGRIANEHTFKRRKTAEQGKVQERLANTREIIVVKRDAKVNLHG